MTTFASPSAWRAFPFSPRVLAINDLAWMSAVFSLISLRTTYIRFEENFATRSLVQKRPSIYNWNPGPRRGKEDAFEKQIAGRWHVITLQEAAEYVDHDLLTNRFHVTHYAGCAILFNKDTLTPTWMSSPSTFMTQDETCLIKSWKENRDGSCKVFFHVPHFVDHQ